MPGVKLNWFKLHPKIAAALTVALTLNASTLAALINGTITWREALVAALTADLPVVVGYLKSGTS